MFTEKQKYWIWLKSLHLSMAQEQMIANHEIDAQELFICAQQKAFSNTLKLNKYSINKLISDATQRKIEMACKILKQNEIGVILRDQKEYPFLLQRIDHPPNVLYYKGDISTLTKKSISIVGTRKPTEYGKALTYSFALALAQADVCIVSGLAFGIDAEAHMGALQSKKKAITIAVLAGGLDSIYPKAHEILAQKISENGLLLSEYPPGHAIHRYSMPLRNRLVAGLSRALFVPEAMYRSGSRHTVASALETGRDVFALPGRVGDDNAQLPNYLIQLGANVALKPDDILNEYGWANADDQQKIQKSIQCTEKSNQSKKVENISIYENLSETEKKIIEQLNNEAMTADQLCLQLGMLIHQVLTCLTKLEQKNMIHKDTKTQCFQLLH